MSQLTPVSDFGDDPGRSRSRSGRRERNHHLLLLVAQLVAIPAATAMGMMGDILYNTVGATNNGAATVLAFVVMTAIAGALAWANWTSYRNVQRKYESSTHSVADLRETLEELLSTTRNEERRAEEALARLSREIDEAEQENEALRQHNEKLHASLRDAMRSLEQGDLSLAPGTESPEDTSIHDRARQALRDAEGVEEATSEPGPIHEPLLGLGILQFVLAIATVVLAFLTGFELWKFVNLAAPVIAALAGIGVADDEAKHWHTSSKVFLVLGSAAVSGLFAAGVTFWWIPWSALIGA